MFIIILYAAGALALIALYVALLVTLTGIFCAHFRFYGHQVSRLDTP